MNKSYAVFDGFGELLTIINADTKHQLSIALDDFADEFIEGCSLQSKIDERDWQTLNGNMGNISILCDISGDNELEVKGVNVRDYTHFPLDAHNET